MSDRRWSLEPLAAALGCTVYALEDRFRIRGTTMQDYRERGVTARVADRLAVEAGLHPAMVWSEWIDDALTVTDRMFLDNGWRQAWLWREQQGAAA